MKIKVNVSVFLGILLCVALMGGVWMMKYGGNSNGSGWNPSQMYNNLGGAARTSATFGSATSSSDDVSVPMTSTRISFRKAPSYAAAYEAAAAALGVNLSTNGSSSVATSPISYTSSSANYQSFGGGGMVASGVNNGSFRANNNNPGAPASLSMPSLPNYASARTISASQAQSSSQGSSAIIAAAPANMPSGFSYSAMYSAVSQVGASAAPAAYIGGARFSGRRNAAPSGGGWDAWLSGLGAGDGFLYVDAEGNRYYDMDLLKAAFEKLKSEGNLPGYLMDWEDFLDAYFNQTGKHNVPLGEAWILLLMAVAYVVLRWRRSKVAL